MKRNYPNSLLIYLSYFLTIISSVSAIRVHNNATGNFTTTRDKNTDNFSVVLFFGFLIFIVVAQSDKEKVEQSLRKNKLLLLCEAKKILSSENAEHLERKIYNSEFIAEYNHKENNFNLCKNQLIKLIDYIISLNTTDFDILKNTKKM